MLALGPKKVVLLENQNTALFYIDKELREKGFAGHIVSVPGDVRDESLLKNLFETHKPAWVLHAAAHKHVPGGNRGGIRFERPTSAGSSAVSLRNQSSPGPGQYQIRAYYRRRWSVENQGFWVLTKRWNLDALAARGLNAIRARLNFVLQLYNAENCCAWKHPGSFQKELPRIKRPPKGERLGKPSIMIYTPEGRVGSFQAAEYRKLLTSAVEKATEAATRNSLKDTISRGLREGKEIEDILREL